MKLLALSVAALLASNAWAGERCTAIDGSTLRCGSERVRIEGVKAPQQGEPGAEQARQRLQRHLNSGEVVVQRKGQDRNGRTLGRLYVNGQRITQSDLAPQRRN